MQRNDEGIVNKVFSETGDAASPAFYDQGFTPAMSTPGSGVFPPRTAFNYLFKILTALAVDVNSSGCMLPWDVLVNYVEGARVIGSNNKVYIALTNNGPANGNASNPTSSPSIWQLSPEYSFGTMAQQNANAVNITGGTINGTNINTILAALGTLANQNANAIAATGGTIDNVAIGLNIPAAAVFTKAVDNGAPPTLASQLTNKSYVDGTVDAESIIFPNRQIIKQGVGMWLDNNQTSGSTIITFATPFPNAIRSVLIIGEGEVNTTTHGHPVAVAANKTNTGFTAIFDSNNPNMTLNHDLPFSWVAFGN